MFYKAKHTPNTSTHYKKHCRQDPAKKENDNHFSTDTSPPLPPAYFFLESRNKLKQWQKIGLSGNFMLKRIASGNYVESIIT